MFLAKIDVVAVIHVRVTSFASSNKFKFINTGLDAANRNDQSLAPPLVFSLDEMVDCSNPRAPFSITSHAEHVSNLVPSPAGAEDEYSLRNQYVNIMGNELCLQ